MTLRIHTFFDSVVLLDSPHFLLDSYLGALVEGFWRYEGEMYDEDFGAFRLETCRSWEIL